MASDDELNEDCFEESRRRDDRDRDRDPRDRDYHEIHDYRDPREFRDSRDTRDRERERYPSKRFQPRSGDDDKAYIIYHNKVMMLLDVDLCAALSDLIFAALDSGLGDNNTAIKSFAHKLQFAASGK